MRATPDKPVRYTKLVRLCGQPVLAESLSEVQSLHACMENRVVSIHHGDQGDQYYAGVGHHLVNVLERIVFPAPLPVSLDTPVHGINQFFSEAL